MRKKLFIGAILIILATPAFLLGRWAYDNHQVVARAQELFTQIPKYPKANSAGKFHSIYSLGYSEQYSVIDDHKTVIDYYKGVVKYPWKFQIESGESGNTNIHEITYKFQEFILIISVDAGNTNLNKSTSPYNLDVDISQVQGQ